MLTFTGVACIGWEHVVRLNDLQFRIADQGVVDRVALGGFDILKPFLVVADTIDADA